MKVLVADDEKIIRSTLQRQLEDSHQVVTASSYQEALDALERNVFDLAFIDLNLDDTDELTGTKLIPEIRKNAPSTILIAMTGLEDPDLIAKCYDLGASDYIFKPIVSKTVGLIVQRAKTTHKLIRQNRSLKIQANENGSDKLVLTTKSPRFQAVLDRATKLKGTKESVLVRGESGAGKEIMMWFLWNLEGDESRPRVPINCGAITATLAETELFGHRKGAFSGATENRIGKFEQADGGDIFLDEVATLTPELQNKLLRVLNDGEITPVGQNLPKKLDVRVIAATNEPLEDMVKAKSFREDLFYRLKQITITIPPLRDRKEDIPDLATLFLKPIGKSLAPDALRFCVEYHWPGNVRELRDTVKAAAIFSDSGEVTLRDLYSQLESGIATVSDVPDISIQQLESHDALAERKIQGNFNKLSREFEQQLVKFALEKTDSDTSAAKYLGIPRSTLRSKLKLWGWNQGQIKPQLSGSTY